MFFTGCTGKRFYKSAFQELETGFNIRVDGIWGVIYRFWTSVMNKWHLIVWRDLASYSHSFSCIPSIFVCITISAKRSSGHSTWDCPQIPHLAMHLMIIIESSSDHVESEMNKSSKQNEEVGIANGRQIDIERR